MKARLERFVDRYGVVVGLVPLVVVWELVGRARVTIAIPPLAEVLDGFRVAVQRDAFEASLVQSVSSLGIGFLMALVVGTVVGVAMGLSRTVKEILGVHVNMMMGAPIAAFVPLIIAVFGIGRAATVTTVFVFSVFIVNTMAGVRAASPTLLQMARSFRAPPRTVLRRIVLPSALPLWLTGVRMAVSRAIAGLVLGEMLVVVVGIGGLIMNAGSAFRMGELWVVIAVVMAFSLVLADVLGILQRHLTGWHSSVRTQR